VLLVGISIAFTLLALLLRSLGTIQLLLLLIGLAWLLSEALSYWERKKRPATDKNG